METEAARALRAARRSGEPKIFTTPTRVASTGLVIPAIEAETGGRRWRVRQDWVCDAGICRLTVPAGWETDLASVPPLMRHYINSFAFGIAGPLLHDFLYEHGGDPPDGTCRPWRHFTRPEVDAMFLQLMRAERVPRSRRHFAYRVVRLLGWTHWEGESSDPGV